MIRRWWPWLAAVLIFCGIGYAVLISLGNSSLRAANAAVQSCYLAKGYRPDRLHTYTLPAAVIQECTQPMRDRSNSMTDLYIAAGAGLLGAVAFLAIVLGFRRATTIDPEETGA